MGAFALVSGIVLTISADRAAAGSRPLTPPTMTTRN